MHKAVVDQFVIPIESKEEFSQRGSITRSFILTLPELLNFSAYSREKEGKIHNLTIAVWKDENAMANAGKAIFDAYRKRGFDRDRFFKELGISLERAVYDDVM